MKKKINLKKSIEEQKFENELKKIKLNLEYGAEFVELPDGNNIPAEVEREFLDHVEQFELAWGRAEQIQIYDFIGRPEYRIVNQLSEAEVSGELEMVLEILMKNQIYLDTLCEVNDHELYRFITEELFFEETDNIRIEGMMHCFIYEEFHPNHDYDIRRTCKELIEVLFNIEHELNKKFLDLTDRIYSQGEVISKEGFIARINKFRESYSTIELEGFDMTSVNIKEEKADVRFETKYSLKIEGTAEIINFSGSGEFGLVKEFDFWIVNRVNIPGLSC